MYVEQVAASSLYYSQTMKLTLQNKQLGKIERYSCKYRQSLTCVIGILHKLAQFFKPKNTDVVSRVQSQECFIVIFPRQNNEILAFSSSTQTHIRAPISPPCRIVNLQAVALMFPTCLTSDTQGSLGLNPYISRVHLYCQFGCRGGSGSGSPDLMDHLKIKCKTTECKYERLILWMWIVIPSANTYCLSQFLF